MISYDVVFQVFQNKQHKLISFEQLSGVFVNAFLKCNDLEYNILHI